MTLSRMQHALIRYLTGYIRTHGYAPTLQEMADALELGSISTVSWHLGQLSAKGMIRRKPGKARSIELIRTHDGLRPYTPVRPPREWLGDRADNFPACPVPDLPMPLGALHRSRELWFALRNQMQPDGELWTFATPAESWKQMLGRAGYASVRNGVVVDGVVVWDQLLEPGDGEPPGG